MPIGLEVNDYDSEDDVSSTEDDNNNETNNEIKIKFAILFGNLVLFIYYFH